MFGSPVSSTLCFGTPSSLAFVADALVGLDVHRERPEREEGLHAGQNADRALFHLSARRAGKFQEFISY